MRIKKGHLKLFLMVVLLFLSITVISTSCACPIFSLFGRFTGLEVKTGKNIDQGRVAGELVYRDSTVLVQVNGDPKRILELVEKYGAAFSEKGMGALDELPQEIREQEISAAIYSTTDKADKVLEYYQSLIEKGWNIQGVENEGQGGGAGRSPIMLFASKGDEKQAFMLSETSNNTFIIFIDFDWEVFLKMNEEMNK